MAIVLAAAGCGLIPMGQGDPSAPVVVSGRVFDADAKPVGGATIQLVVNDYGAAVNVGDTVPTVYQQSFSAGPDGTFSLHLAPTPELLAFAAKEGGFVNFDLNASIGTTAARWGFPRELSGGAWMGDVPFVELRPIGSGVPGQDPGVPAPEPAAT